MEYILPLLGLYNGTKKKSIWVILLVLVVLIVNYKETTISSVLIILTAIILPASLLSSWSNVKYNEQYYVTILLLFRISIIKSFLQRII